jgi:L-lactate dehydrogenase complex protein LldG
VSQEVETDARCSNRGIGSPASPGRERRPPTNCQEATVMKPATDIQARFRQKAELVSAFVTDVKSCGDALAYAVDMCDRKEACQLLVSGCEEALSPKAEALCERKQQKIIAAPGLPAAQTKALESLCRDRGIRLLTDDLRSHLAGIDVGLTQIDYGIAETGTLVLDSSDEDLRLATMVSEVHIGILPVSKIRERAEDLETELQAYLQSTPNYLAFITGASRTADIERVLALGVHGPLELHIVLLED